MSLATWSDVLTQSFQSLWINVISYIPTIFVALVIFLAGWVTGAVVGEWVGKIIKSLRIDRFLTQLGVREVVEKAGYRLDAGMFIGALVKWFVILAFLIASVDVLGLNQVNVFLEQVIGYIPNIVVASLILIIGAFLADFLSRLIVASARAAGMKGTRTIGNIVRWAVWIFALLAALSQLGIASFLFQTLWTGVVAALALAIGLAFGLGGKEAAARLLDRVGGEDK
ncbi:MAG: hypothetical protein NTY66_01190 [Candidatus Vogelbacteria bacterium]|nr:hypothetical protein [Candidatus Vogelbacteria bacterium]